MKKKFADNTERGFYDYMLSQRHYKESTVWDYIRRIRRIEAMDTLITKNLDLHIADYEQGAHKEKNKSCHNALSCAFKRLREYQQYMGIVVI